MTDNDYLSLLLIIQGVTAVVGPHLPVSGMSWPLMIASTGVTTAPAFFDTVSWIWNSITFLFGLATFQVANVGTVISAIFCFMGIMTWWLIIKLIRGTGG